MVAWSMLIGACVGAPSLSAFGLGATHQMVLVAARNPAPSDFPTRRHHHFFWNNYSGSFSGTAVHGPLAWILGLCGVLVPLAIAGLVVWFNLRNRRQKKSRQTGFGGLETPSFASSSFDTGGVSPSIPTPQHPGHGGSLDGLPLGAWPTPDGKPPAGRSFGTTGWLVLVGGLVVAATVGAGVLFATVFNRGMSMSNGPGGASVATGGTPVSGAPGGQPSVSGGGTTASAGGTTVSAPPGGSISVAGIGENRTVACNDSQVDVSGFTNTVTITGHCASLTVSGEQNHVTVDAADTISASGFNNEVTFHSGSPQVDNSGTNVVQQG